MARRRSRSRMHGLGGTKAEHAEEMALSVSEAEAEVVGARRALSKGNCKAAAGRLITASILYGHAKAHAEEADTKVSESLLRGRAALEHSVLKKCFV